MSVHPLSEMGNYVQKFQYVVYEQKSVVVLCQTSNLRADHFFGDSILQFAEFGGLGL